MPERGLRRRSAVAGGGRKIKPPHPSPRRNRASNNPSPASGRPANSYKHSAPIAILKRCASEPSLKVVTGGSGSEGDDGFQTASLFSESEGSSFDGGSVLYRPNTCTDVFCSSSASLVGFSPSHGSDQGYNRDAKVVLSVTVEGSPGPVRAMVKLGSSVGDAIKLVVEKYGEERRTPKLEKDAATSYELHHSYFSLECLDKSSLIGDAGSRSFYLRRSSSSRNRDNSSAIAPPARASGPPVIPPPPFLLPTFIARKLGKIIRRTRRLWKVVVCWK